ncbi:hypothetical protein A2690_04120 [Candidatus Roizmanbacteria bacterium RIFCSPHIGHO2_01_FULL_39_12b]|uniref:CAAX prenyl protease 2/Lysostaphin resistance protein A-like domain-containing protein n=1 Tax=Candidatus Roizmanbacteria bacterium RIFCSPHIGHO2_01_FULL_39_12b TaxID=1802030 RepID=A0A1F7GCA1_9BACT|nr:MAG: hypothetical protein A2690_04120 [Candidatus Roizmanbacteria bacterium RIFCSPHIGHO2_01_FULL_39_12b]OGK47128.1 MAG: hypothetical protein A3B46_01845 [Candidatus Roizmanbacteria bacterium RIFCSPLOWO2_01_FULL_39_19]
MKKPLSPMQKALNLWAIVLILWSVYRTKLALPEWFDEFVAKPLVFVLPVYFYIRNFELKPFFESIYLTRANLFNNVKIALGIGVLLTGSAVAANYFRHGTFSFSNTLFNVGAQNLPIIVIISLATAISEELLSRGFLLKRLYEDSGNIYASSFLSSILFLVLHIPILFTNIQLQGSLILLFLMTDFILSMVNSFLFLDGKNLISPILVHTFYNLAIILYV